jgi:hypothetical protein
LRVNHCSGSHSGTAYRIADTVILYLTALLFGAYVEEMGNCSSVAGTVFSKIRGFSMVSRKKDANQDTHKMIDHSIRIRFA